jgi:hypothetical protein
MVSLSKKEVSLHRRNFFFSRAPGERNRVGGGDGLPPSFRGAPTSAAILILD